MSTLRLGLIANTAKSGAFSLVQELCQKIADHGSQVLLESRTAQLMGAGAGVPISELADQCELVIVLGGDGTLLQAVHDLGDRLPPIFGINLGSLGFLTSVSSEAWARAVECLVAGDYKLSERTLLAVEVVRGGVAVHCETALNEAVISRGELLRLIKIDMLIDGGSVTGYNADGLIVATPTGSTAYALSAGGPVLTPESGVFVVVPICPHVLTMRPIIVSDANAIEIVPACEQSEIFLTLDGQDAIRIEPGDRILVRKAKHKLSLAMLPGMTFFEVLRQKLKWSGTAV